MLIQGGRSAYKLAPFYDLLCVHAYGDDELALFIGDEDHFDAVGRHSWEAFCADCSFGLHETLKVFQTLADALLPAWQKVQATVVQQLAPTPPERDLLARMTAVFTQHQRHALSMLGACGLRAPFIAKTA